MSGPWIMLVGLVILAIGGCLSILGIANIPLLMWVSLAVIVIGAIVTVAEAWNN